MLSKTTPATVIDQFRLIALLEGISLLVLMFIAMPLKYFAGMPSMVKYTGWLHGILFLLYLVFLLQVWIKYRWSFLMVFLAFLASLFPFGTFLLDKKLKRV